MDATLSKRVCEFMEVAALKSCPLPMNLSYAGAKPPTASGDISELERQLVLQQRSCEGGNDCFLGKQAVECNQIHQRVARKPIEEKLIARDGNSCFLAPWNLAMKCRRHWNICFPLPMAETTTFLIFAYAANLAI